MELTDNIMFRKIDVDTKLAAEEECVATYEVVKHTINKRNIEGGELVIEEEEMANALGTLEMKRVVDVGDDWIEDSVEVEVV